jgi:hypothetical protein
VFLLTKAATYYWDAEAVKEAQQGDGRKRGCVISDERIAALGYGGTRREVQDNGTRNLRSVWTIATQPFKGAHFATMPQKLAETCIKAGTSERGCCPKCREPWERMAERKGGPPNNRFRDGLAGDCKTAHSEGTVAGAALSRLYRDHGYPEITTLGWRPTCSCGETETRPCVVLDPFSGAGTTGLVATKLGRAYIGIELKEAYNQMARSRLEEKLGLFMPR